MNMSNNYKDLTDSENDQKDHQLKLENIKEDLRDEKSKFEIQITVLKHRISELERENNSLKDELITLQVVKIKLGDIVEFLLFTPERWMEILKIVYQNGANFKTMA